MNLSPRAAQALAAVAVFAAGALAFALGVFAPADRLLHDRAARWLREHHPQPVERDVVLVGIDEQSYRALREPFALWHAHLGRFLKGMAATRPAALGLDIVLPERSYDFLVPGQDRALAEGLLALRQAAPPVPLALARSIDESGAPRPVHPPFASFAGDAAFGSTAVCREPDQVVRRFDEAGCAGGPTLAGRMARALGAAEPGRGLIDWAAGDALRYLPFHEVLGWIERGEQARLDSAFRGRPVLLGSVLPYQDRHALPVNLAAFEPEARVLPGVLIHAQALRSLLHRGLVRDAPPALAWSLALLALCFVFGASGWRKAVVLAAAVIAALAGSVIALWQGMSIGGATLVLLALAAALARTASDALAQARERRLLRGAFAAYVSPPVLKNILAGRLRVEGTGLRARVCVLALELPDFETRAAALPPDRAVALLDAAFRGAADAVLRRGGSTHRFSGHGMLALFGAPEPLANAGRSALEAAQEILAALDVIGRTLAAGGDAPLAAGIGIASGAVALGHVGGETHREYTAIGPAVDGAQTLARRAAQLGHPVLCDDAVAAAVGGAGGLAEAGDAPGLGRLWCWRPPRIAPA